jgi:MarR family transcriptional regulator, organic hydroperoxide resistance regulator
MARVLRKRGLPPEESLGFQVRRCHRAFDRVLHAHLAPVGLSSGFWYFLRALWQENGATQKRLAQLNNVTEPTAVTLLAAMERLDLIRRDRNTQDRRKINVFLTPRGEALEGDLIPTAARINAIAGEGIAPGDLATCLSVLKRMTDNLANEAARAAASQRAADM